MTRFKNAAGRIHIRRAPNMRECLAALLVDYLHLDRAAARGMSADQICALVDWDHMPVPFATARALGWRTEQIHHPTNIQPLTRSEHRVKTSTRDVPQIAKGRRLTAAHDEMRRRLLAKTGLSDAINEGPPRVGLKRKWPSKKIPSRPFPKKTGT